jgi:predicted dithiol-disulfide oxidoreductase (DUF899 family)
MTKSPENDRKGGQLAMHTPPIVSPQAWEAARQQMLVKEKALMRARDALAAERRRMPWMAVEKAYEFEGPQGKVSLLDLFEGRRQLVVYRAFFEPGVFGWPEHACRGCSLGADQVAHLAHLNVRDTTLAYASRAPQADIARLKARMGWEMPWYTITDSFDADFGVDEWHGHNVFFRNGERVFRTYFINNRGDEAMGSTWSYLDATPLGRQEMWEDSPEGYPQWRLSRWPRACRSPGLCPPTGAARRTCRLSTSSVVAPAAKERGVSAWRQYRPGGRDSATDQALKTAHKRHDSEKAIAVLRTPRRILNRQRTAALPTELTTPPGGICFGTSTTIC